MAKVDGSLGTLIQGVSQQPDRARRAGQSQEQVNLINDEVFGLSRRAPTKFVHPLNGFDDLSQWEGSEYGFVEDEAGTVLFWHCHDGTLRIYNVKTGALIETFEDDYLPTNGEGNIKIATVNGQILVLNTDTVVAMDTSVQQDYSDGEDYVIYARGGASGTRFRIVIRDSVMSTTVSVKTSNTDADQITAGWVTDRLYGLLTGTTPAGDDFVSTGGQAHLAANYTFSLKSDHILIRPNGATNNSVSVEDDSGTQLLVACRDTVKEVGRLPVRAVKNQVVRVIGDANVEDDYYVRWEVDSSAATGTFEDRDGTWVETSSPDTNYRIDNATMPHTIAGTGPYTFNPVTWDDKTAGDDDSNPDPKFIGDRIRDLIEFQDRLVFLHGRDISMSQSGVPSNFFLQTATALLDDDTLHVTPTTGRRSNILSSAVISNRDLIIFAENNAQFTISGRSKIVPQTVSVALTAEFSMNTGFVPEPVGNVVFYMSTVGDYSEMSELYLLGQEDVHDRRSVSNHVPRYIPKTVDSIIADDGSNFAVVWDRSNGNEAYLYEYLWQDNSRVQSAWSRWTFSDKIRAARVDGTTVTMIMEQGAGIPAYIAVMDLSRGSTGDLGVEVHLDRMQYVSGNTVTLPSNEDYVAVMAEGPEKGLPATVSETTSVGSGLSTYAISGEASGYFVGLRYKTRFVPTMPVIKDGEGVARSAQDLSISTFLLDVRETGPFRMVRETDFDSVENYWLQEWEGFSWDTPEFQPGSIPMSDSKVQFTFEENAATSKLAIESDDYLPMNIVEIEWFGYTRGRSSRINTGG